ncbi:MAG: TIGR01777 family protein [Flavobacteriales bacterium]|nr:TIGR01777 family protein [Flavobacteriales bacterium]MCB9197445.1 TIGR01777 family protein [Flavobacteriales bacterium]
MKKLIIAGGTGFLGKEISKYYLNKGYTVKILTRTPKEDIDIYWDGKSIGQWQYELENATLLINLSGKSVDCRYTAENRKLILDSRIESTKILQKAVESCVNPPKTWMNASTATIYKGTRTHQNTEDNGIIGDDFSMNIAKSWERTFFEKDTPAVRKVALRISLVLGESGGVLPVLYKLARFGLGGRAGDGKQKFAHVRIEELLDMIRFIEENEALNGPINCTNNLDLTNEEFMRSLRQQNKIKCYINQPEWMIRLGAKIIGTEPELILKNRYVYPKKLEEAGFNFNKHRHV